MKKTILMALIFTMALMIVSSGQAIIIADWVTVDEQGNVTTPSQLYKFTGQLADYPKPYGLLPFHINNVDIDDRIIFDFKVYKRSHVENVPNPQTIYVSSVVSVNGGSLENLPITPIRSENVMYGEADFTWYRVDYVIPSNARTVAMHFDTNFHLDPLEETEKVYMYFQTPLNTVPLTANVVAEYDNKDYAVFDEISVINIFDYNEYSHVENREVVIDKEKPDSLVGYIVRTNENIYEFGDKTKFGSWLFTIVFYLLLLLVIYGVGTTTRRIIYRLKR